MPDLLPFLIVAPVYALAMVSPGPSFLLVSSCALAQGRAAGVKTGLGVAAGEILYIVLSLWGMALMIEKMAWLALVIKIAGGLFLVYLGVQAWRSTLGPKRATGIPEAPKTGTPFTRGFLVSVANPKTMAFFASIFALALRPDMDLITRLTTGALCGILPLLWFPGVALLLSAPRVRNPYLRCQRAIDRVAGSVLLFFGAKLLWSARAQS